MTLPKDAQAVADTSPEAAAVVDAVYAEDGPLHDQLDSHHDEAPKAELSDEAPKWAYQTIEYNGETLQVRKPQPKALAAFSLATGKYVPQTVRNDMTSYFIWRHFSPETYEKVFHQLMDPDDEVYTVETIGEMMRGVVTQE